MSGGAVVPCEGCEMDKPVPPYSREQLMAMMRQLYPDPHNVAFSPEDVVRRMIGEEEDNKLMKFPPHLREFFGSLNHEDCKKLRKVLTLNVSTIEWIGHKNDRELSHLDNAVEFVTSSRTAARVLMWVAGLAVAFISGTWTLAKLGFDVFSTFRGVGK